MNFTATKILTTAYLNNAVERLRDYLSSITLYHFTEDEMKILENNELFSDVTSIDYSIEDYRDYIYTFLISIVEKSGLEELYNTNLFNLITEMLELKDVSNDFYTLMIVNEIMDYNDFSNVTTSDFHKKLVMSVAASLCLSKKNISFNTAVKTVCQNEKKGIPAYRQQQGSNSSTVAAIEELARFKDYIIENDSVICLDIITSMLGNYENDL